MGEEVTTYEKLCEKTKELSDCSTKYAMLWNILMDDQKRESKNLCLKQQLAINTLEGEKAILELKIEESYGNFYSKLHQKFKDNGMDDEFIKTRIYNEKDFKPSVSKLLRDKDLISDPDLMLKALATIPDESWSVLGKKLKNTREVYEAKLKKTSFVRVFHSGGVAFASSAVAVAAIGFKYNLDVLKLLPICASVGGGQVIFESFIHFITSQAYTKNVKDETMKLIFQPFAKALDNIGETRYGEQSNNSEKTD